MNTFRITEDISEQAEAGASILANMLRRNVSAVQPVPSNHVTPRALKARIFYDPAHDMPRFTVTPFELPLDLSKKAQEAKAAADVATTSKAAAKKPTKKRGVPQPTGTTLGRPAQLVVPASAAPARRLTIQGEVLPHGATIVRQKRPYKRVERVNVGPVEPTPAPKRVRTIIRYKKNP